MIKNIIQKIESKRLIGKESQNEDCDIGYNLALNDIKNILKEESERAFSPESFGFLVNDTFNKNYPNNVWYLNWKAEIATSKTDNNNIYFISMRHENFSHSEYTMTQTPFKIDSHFTAEIIFKSLGIIK